MLQNIMQKIENAKNLTITFCKSLLDFFKNGISELKKLLSEINGLQASKKLSVFILIAAFIYFIFIIFGFDTNNKEGEK
jgi:hypothetical protein